MAEKICDFCGEPIAGGLQEHDFATCAHNLKDKVVQLEAELAGMKLMEAEAESFAEGIVAENERLREHKPGCWCCCHVALGGE